MANKRPLGQNGANGSVQYPVLPKRPKIDGGTSETRVLGAACVHDEEDLANFFDSDDLEDFGSSSDSSDEPPTPAKAETKFQLSPKDIPPGAKKVYCVRRGHTPGFYFEYAGANGAQVQVNGFQDNLFMSFPQGKKASINVSTMAGVIADAVHFMNHGPQSCKYSCRGKCGIDESFQPKPKPEEPKPKDPTFCRECQKQPPHKLPGERWRICHSCWLSSDIQIPIQRSVQKYQLTEEQSKVLELVAKGRNVFFTGAAGTGKSRVLEAIVNYLARRETRSKVVAPTGKLARSSKWVAAHMVRNGGDQCLWNHPSYVRWLDCQARQELGERY